MLSVSSLNLIAYGEYPVIIDLETFIQQPNSFNDDVLNEKINYEFDSVKRTLLLESRLRQNDVNEGIDISAINGNSVLIVFYSRYAVCCTVFWYYVTL